MFKRILSLVMCICMVLSMYSSLSFAQESQNVNYSDNLFNDVSGDDWFYESVKYMHDKGVIDGFEDGSFQPQKFVTRAQFAKILVLAFELPRETSEIPTFSDVDLSDWSYEFAESAKSYLTGYKSGDDLYFKGNETAQREDMAVAIVKAKKIDVNNIDLSILDKFKDKDKMSENLKSYIAAAVQNNIMEGYGNGYFGPKNSLTRAEASTLLYRALGNEDEKIIIGDETIKSKAPVASPGSGTYIGPQNVTFKNQSNGADIYYTLQDPTRVYAQVMPTVDEVVENWKKWDGKDILISETIALKAVNVVIPETFAADPKPPVQMSSVATFNYTINNKEGIDQENAGVVINAYFTFIGEKNYVKAWELTSDRAKEYYSMEDAIDGHWGIESLELISIKEQYKDENRALYSAIFMVKPSLGTAWNDGENSRTVELVKQNDSKWYIDNITTDGYFELEAPVASPGSGTYNESIKVNFPNAFDEGKSIEIYYTLDGSDPYGPISHNLDGANYVASDYMSIKWDGQPILISETTTLKAVKVGYDKRSKVATFKYVINNSGLEAPVTLPGSGTYTEPQNVTFVTPMTIKNVAGVDYSVYYTLDGTEPIVPGEVFTNDVNASVTKKWDGRPILINKTTALKAVAVKGTLISGGIVTNKVVSKVATFKYVINNSGLEAPVTSPGSGTYKESQNVTFVTPMTIKNVVGVDYSVYCTLDGTEPIVPGEVFTNDVNASVTKKWDGRPILIGKTTTLKAVAVKGTLISGGIVTNKVVSKVATFNYIMYVEMLRDNSTYIQVQ